MHHMPHEEQKLLAAALESGGCSAMLAEISCGLLEITWRKTQEELDERFPELSEDEIANAVGHTAFGGLIETAMALMASVESSTMSLHNSALALLVAEWLTFGRDQPRADRQLNETLSGIQFSEISFGDFLRRVADSFDKSGDFEADCNMRQGLMVQDQDHLIETFTAFLDGIVTTDDPESGLLG